MIEKRTLWLVDAMHHIESVTALYDTDRQEVVNYNMEGHDCYFQVEGYERVFPTLGEAEAYVSERRAYLKAKMPEVKAFLDEMSELIPSDEFQFDRKDYLPEGLASPPTPSYYDDYWQERHVTHILGIAIGQKMLCIGGSTIPLDRINQIDWYDDCLEISLFDNRQNIPIVTRDKAEIKAVKVLFGDNVSGRGRSNY